MDKFLQLVWPIASTFLDKGTITLSGDIATLQTDTEVIQINVRIREAKAFESFIIPLPYTQKEGYILQAYIVDNSLEYVCMCKAKDIYRLFTPKFINKHGEAHRTVKKDGQSFAIFSKLTKKPCWTAVNSWHVRNKQWLEDYENAVTI